MLVLVVVVLSVYYACNNLRHNKNSSFSFFFAFFFCKVTSSTRDEVDFDKTAHKKKYSILVSSIPPHSWLVPYEYLLTT